MSATRRTPAPVPGEAVVWHEVECGPYRADLPLWRALAAEHPGPILDVGAGTGRVALDLAGRGHRVTALDRDGALLAELARRAGGLAVETVRADARAFDLGARFALAIAPMQMVQLLRGARERLAFLRCARRHLLPAGVLAIALTEELQAFEAGAGPAAPVPDMLERDGVLWSSTPTAIREVSGGYVLERRRERVARDGRRSVQLDRVTLARLSAERLEDEARQAGLAVAPRRYVEPTLDHVGSVVVMLGA